MENKSHYTGGLGNKCTRCGCDLSTRAGSTKHCYDCAKIISNEAATLKRDYFNLLKARDTVLKGNVSSFRCPCCDSPVVTQGAYFCWLCGKRLKEDDLK